jgi:hypothetical protein
MAEGEASNPHEIGANLMLVDYRGYGYSSPITPDEKTVDEDALAALTYLVRQRGVPIGKVVVLGRSVGSGPATYLAVLNAKLAGLILESPFSSIDDAAACCWFSRVYPVGLMLRTHFDNLWRIAFVRTPLLIVSGTADTLTPVWTAEKLFARARQPKQLYLVQNAGHNDLVGVGANPLTQLLRKFVQEAR